MNFLCKEQSSEDSLRTADVFPVRGAEATTGNTTAVRRLSEDDFGNYLAVVISISPRSSSLQQPRSQGKKKEPRNEVSLRSRRQDRTIETEGAGGGVCVCEGRGVSVKTVKGGKDNGG